MRARVTSSCSLKLHSSSAVLDGAVVYCSSPYVFTYRRWHMHVAMLCTGQCRREYNGLLLCASYASATVI